MTVGGTVTRAPAAKRAMIGASSTVGAGPTAEVSFSMA